MSQYWEGQVNALVNALKEHEKSIYVDTDHFKKILLPHDLSWDIQSTYQPIVAENNKPQESVNNLLSIDGIIYNMRMQQVLSKLATFHVQQFEPLPKNNIWQRSLQRVFCKPISYSVDKVLNDLKDNEDMISAMMSLPAEPYTLLCRFSAISYDAEGGYTISTRPVLVKPNITPEHEKKIYQWEVSHIVVEKDEKFLGRF